MSFRTETPHLRQRSSEWTTRRPRENGGQTISALLKRRPREPIHAGAGIGAATHEPTAGQGERGFLTGVATDEEGSCLVWRRPWPEILVEEDPDAECGGNRGPLAPGCDETYFDATRGTDVFWRVGDTREAAPVADLRKGLRVSADSAATR